MRKLNLLAAVLLASIFCGVAHAQNGSIATAPIYNWSYQRHASTPTEGYLRGQASVLQAAGQTNYANSLAAVNFQEAYRRQLENSRLYVQTFFERRELANQYFEKYKPAPLTKEQWERISQASLPDRLSPQEYDPVTGKLVWPHILRTEQYAALRNRVNELMAARTPENSGDGSPTQKELSQLIDGLKLLLKENIDSVTPQQYAGAKWFLLSLDYEAELPVVASKPPAPVEPAAAPATEKPAAATAS